MTNEFASQIEFVPVGRGFVDIVSRHRSGDRVIETLQYTQQGRMVGSDPVDVENARRLNEAAEPLNEALRSL